VRTLFLRRDAQIGTDILCGTGTCGTIFARDVRKRRCNSSYLDFPQVGSRQVLADLGYRRQGDFSAGADRTGQFQQWTPRQFRGRKPLINRDLLQRIAPLFPREVSAPFRSLSADREKVPLPGGPCSFQTFSRSVVGPRLMPFGDTRQTLFIDENHTT
jgi:hypothetical protein